MKRKIIIADANKQSNKLIKNILSAAGYEVLSTLTFSECQTLISIESPDLIIIDPLYPDNLGIKTVKRLREWGGCEILAISENGTERAITDIIDAGADDYIKKPFLSGELLARIKASIRRRKDAEKLNGINTEVKYSANGLTVDFDRRIVAVNGNEVHLTKNEFKILTLLCRYSGRVLTYDFIIKYIWGSEILNGNGILRVNIANLRKKIEQNREKPLYLFTENGVGYRVAENQITSDNQLKI